jgi:DMSO/TMAO reductase YedYZ heme-binding membrane subunit
VPTTSGRSRGRQGVHSGARRAAGDHTRTIMTAMVAAAVIVIFVLVMTAAGRDIDAATQHFMLFYAGVFALIGLTGSVMVGLVATDRIVMTPGHRVMAQAVHRAVSFGALTFLVIHIVTEILAQRVHVIDAFIPFLSPFRTFYIGLGTIASDLIVLIVVTSILRKRFTGHGHAWRWRAIHYSSYAAFVFGVMHGLLGGRAAKPYVDWSYGFAIALTAVGLAVRFLAISLRPKESVSTAPRTDHTRSASSAPLHAAALSMAQAQLGGTVQMLPAGMAMGSGMPGSGSWPVLPAAREWPASSGPIPALGPASAYASEFQSGAHLSAPPAQPYRAPEAYRSPEPSRSADAYRELGFAPLGAPPYGDDGPATFRGRPYMAMDSPTPTQAGQAGAAGPGYLARQPLYEPGYDGPPRFAGAPREHVPQDELSSYPYGLPGHGPSGAGYPDSYPDREESGGRNRPRHRRAIEPSAPGPAMPGHPLQGQGGRNTGPIPRADTGPMPRMGTGPMPRAGTGPMPRAGTGPMPRAGTGPMPRAGTGPMPRAGTGPMPRAGTGPMPRAGTGPMPRAGTGPMPRAGTGPMPRAGTGPMPRVGSGPMPRAGTGPIPRARTGPMPRAGTGPMPRADSGPMLRADSGPMLRADSGPMLRADSGPMLRAGTGPMPRVGSGPMPAVWNGPAPRADNSPIPHAGPGPATRGSPGAAPRRDTSPAHQAGTGARPRIDSPTPPGGPAPAPRDGRPSSAAGRQSRRRDSADPGYREASGPTGGDERR